MLTAGLRHYNRGLGRSLLLMVVKEIPINGNKKEKPVFLF